MTTKSDLLQSAIAPQGIGLLQFAARPFIGRCKCKMVPSGNNTQNHMITKHILRTHLDVAADLRLNEQTGDFNCVWKGLPRDLTQAVRDKILSAYLDVISSLRTRREQKHSTRKTKEKKERKGEQTSED